MNRRQLAKLGVPEWAAGEAICALQEAVSAGFETKIIRETLRLLVADPSGYLSDPHFGTLAKTLSEQPVEEVREPISYRTWGSEFIDEHSHAQMRDACRLPSAVGAALMPDAHIGYGLPIGGVLALENAICPYAVGVDIACRMKLSVFDLPVERLLSPDRLDEFSQTLERGTLFGTGGRWKQRQHHDVMDQDWSVSRVTRENKDKAWSQLGTSGSGNHFVEYGVLTLFESLEGIPAGEYVSLLSHSGSRGTGHAVCSTYSAIAQRNLPRRHQDFGRLAWLDMDSQAGMEYWAAMNLMGDYAAANHAVIHRNVAKLLGADSLGGVENHHNFAWKETHFGKDVYVHRKGATPAGKGVLGVIPGSMGTPAYVVRGLGHPESLNSASHGAGRVMSRTKANETFRFNAVRADLKQQGVTVLSAGSDEVPGVYKDIDQVIAAQTDLVEVVARFDPKIVKMCGDGSRPED